MAEFLRTAQALGLTSTEAFAMCPELDADALRETFARELEADRDRDEALWMDRVAVGL